MFVYICSILQVSNRVSFFILTSTKIKFLNTHLAFSAMSEVKKTYITITNRDNVLMMKLCVL